MEVFFCCCCFFYLIVLLERIDIKASDISPTMTLNEYLRETQGLKGTKLVIFIFCFAVCGLSLR